MNAAPASVDARASSRGSAGRSSPIQRSQPGAGVGGLPARLYAFRIAADLRRSGSRGPEPGRQHVGGVAQRPVAGIVGEDAVVVAVLAGQVGRPRRAAERRGDREVGNRVPPSRNRPNVFGIRRREKSASSWSSVTITITFGPDQTRRRVLRGARAGAAITVIRVAAIAAAADSAPQRRAGSRVR